MQRIKSRLNRRLAWSGLVLGCALGVAACGDGGADSTAAPALADKSIAAANIVGDDDRAQIAVDANGNAFAVWERNDGLRIHVMANRYVAGKGWEKEQLIETNDLGNARSPQIAVDTNGNSIAVWHQYGEDGSAPSIWANRYVAGEGWGTAQLIETDGTAPPMCCTPAYSPQISMDTNGNALVVWQQSDGTRQNIWVNRYLAGTGWGTAELIETNNSGSATAPQIAFDAGGNALAVWEQYDGTRISIWANRYVAGAAWGTAELIETNNAGDAVTPKIALDASGNAIAVWQQSDGIRANVWANRYVVGAGWGKAELIETEAAWHANEPQVAVSANGNAMAVWRQGGNDGLWGIWANRYTPGAGWSAPEPIETITKHAFTPQIAVDANGNAIAVWGQDFSTWANRYTTGQGWGVAELIESKTYSTTNPQIAFNANGNATAVWTQGDKGTQKKIWSNQFTAGKGWGTAVPIGNTTP
jgi:hypothetical protein